MLDPTMTIRVGAGGNVPSGTAEPADGPVAHAPAPQHHKKERWGAVAVAPAREWRPAQADPAVAKEIRKLQASLTDKKRPNDPGIRGSQQILESLISPSVARQVLHHQLKGPGGERFAPEKIKGLPEMLRKIEKGEKVDPGALKEMAKKLKQKMVNNDLFWTMFITNMKTMQEEAHKKQLEAAKKGGK
jgi:hypothetical protein